VKDFCVGLFKFGVVLIVCWQVYTFYLQASPDNVGWYGFGQIRIYPYKISGFTDYQFIANHEWGHHVWKAYLNQSDRDNWAVLVEDCGFVSDYAKSFTRKYRAIEEDFADSVSFYLVFGRIHVACDDKLVLLDNLKLRGIIGQDDCCG
jgi:hypothetical protein